MRQKFRCWDKKEKKFIKLVSIDFSANTVTSFEHRPKGSYSHYSFDDVELIESTGLKDKNGKEIYEGDIVKHTVYRTCWKEPSKDLIIIGREDCPFISCGWICEDSPDDDYAIKFENEVIGNIYENPKLLEDKK